eukprot:TRINITY_DN13631_c0_g2_i2.p1 TRINITY_DN13631_c0_g2~~TRINITY_DN13631_c0_g2_i2.p1  ORF type:complete len:142 (+),score=21.66 TRINITY_DN13631_c0_g2_i2:117-542(+)
MELDFISLHLIQPSQELICKMMVLSTYRLHLCDESEQTVDTSYYEALLKRGDSIDIPYYDMVGFFHDGKRNFSVHSQAQGQLKVHSFRSADFSSVMERIVHRRSIVCGLLPNLVISGPPLSWKVVEFHPAYKTQHFCEFPF